MTDGVTKRGVARAKRRRSNLAAPCERRPARLGRRAYKRAAPNIPAQQAARLELAIGADDSGAADPEALGKLTFGRQSRSRWQLPSRNGRFKEIDEMPVERARGPHELTLDQLKHRPSRTVAV